MSKSIKKTLQYDPNFLQCSENKCYMCNRDRTLDSSVRVYFKYSHTKLKVSNSFTTESKVMNLDSKFREIFLLCDSCLVYWKKTPESSLSNSYYRKFFQTLLEKRPVALAKKKKYNRENYLKKLERGK